ncbi:helicase-associated domain-containing protein [Paenibacillus sp. P96]|uniref:Helicase-associated domain-containing protein n=1 Tax=Paenibacillus zeirhizosphaerae TaxID=2987519 RepID=A0ABT9FQ41_9BACL|nr:helicase-associated domain-containing protein [Paenibacillus sp. P96]MDP4096838.1 helicase-associated domain-containing protein [Paenibacillus sp. P96]
MAEMMPKELEGVLHGLTPEEKLLLKRCFIRYAGQPMEEEAPVRLLEGRLSGAECRIAVLGLRQKGWLEAVVKSWGERLLFIPGKRLPELYKLLLGEQQKVPAESRRPEMLLEAGEGTEARLLHVLAWIARYGLPLTSKGTIHKRALVKLNELSLFKDSALQGLGLQYAHSEVYPLSSAVLLDLLLSLGLLVKETSAYTVHTPALFSWIKLPQAQMSRWILLTVMERYGRTQPAAQHLRGLLCMTAPRTGEWMAVDSLLKWLEQVGAADNLDLREEADQWLTVLAEFGLADKGVTEAGSLCIRWRVPVSEMMQPDFSLAEQEQGVFPERSGFYIQPDFEIIVPPECGFEDRWLLECCAEQISAGRMSLYRLSRESITGAVESGMELQDLEAFLAGHSFTGVPDNVVHAVRQWAGGTARTAFAAVTLLRCRSREDADAAAMHPRLGGVLERLGELDFIVPPGEEEEVRKELASLGLTPRKGMEGSGSTVPSFPLPPLEALGLPFVLEDAAFYAEGRPGLVYTGRTLHFYDKDAEVPSPESFFPGRSSVPSSWFSQLRPYHPSTARQIMEQAVEWQTAVMLRSGDEDTVWLPEAVSGGADWQVTGRFRSPEGTDPQSITVLKPCDWKEMRLLLPIPLS